MSTTSCYTTTFTEIEVTVDAPIGADNFALVGTQLVATGIGASNGLLTLLVSNLPIGVYYVNYSYEIGEETFYGYYVVNIVECLPAPVLTNWNICRGWSNIETEDCEFTIQITFPNGETYNDFAEDDTLPAGVTISETGLLTIPCAKLDAMANAPVDFTYDTDKTVTLTFNVIDCDAPTASIFTECEKESIGIVWINQEGGRQSYWFNQIKEYKINQSDGRDYINSVREKRWYNKGRVVDAVYINQEYIPFEHLAFLNSLKNSIQAWYCTDIENEDTYQSIILNQDSWTVRRTNDRFYSVQFQFEFSKAKIIQQQ